MLYLFPRMFLSVIQMIAERLNAEDYEGEDEVRPEFSCPYCDEDFDISSLCTHLEDEHLFESKGVVSSNIFV